MNPLILEEALGRFPHQHLLVIGDLMIDRYVLGDVKRISPEAPVMVFPESAVQDRLGGAGNVARTVKALGGKVSFIGVIGNDTEGELAYRLFGQLLLEKCYLIKDSQRPTSLKTRYLSQNQQLIRVDREETSPISASLEKELLSCASSIMEHVDGVILSDYAKGLLTEGVTQALIKSSRNHSLPVFIDPKARSFRKYQGASWITPNRRELEEASQQALPQADDIARVALESIQAYGLQGILATRSEQGMSLIQQDRISHLPAKVADVFDVSGAGDTVIGTFALGITAGLDALTAAELSNHAAGVVVKKSGTATVTPDELRKDLVTAIRSFSSKICTQQEAKKRVAEWQSQGFRIGFTNGCFDILHPGHMALLRQASMRCDRLVVGLNTDASIKRLKGEERPIHDFFHRSSVLEALEAIDMVVGFEEDTPLSLIMALKPDVLFKGADYKIEEVIGAKEIMNWGGTTIVLDLVEGYSTTATINRLKAFNPKVA